MNENLKNAVNELFGKSIEGLDESVGFLVTPSTLCT